MNRPDLSNLAAKQSHQTTYYEVEVLLGSRWVLDRVYDTLPAAQACVSMNKENQEDSRVVVVSEIRRIAA